MENKKKKLIALVIGIILIILVGGLVFYLTSHLTKTTICKGKLDMITTEEVEIISSDEKLKKQKHKLHMITVIMFQICILFLTTKLYKN